MNNRRKFYLTFSIAIFFIGISLLTLLSYFIENPQKGGPL